MIKVPTLETERLILRPWRAEDHEPYAHFFADERTARYVGGVKNSDEAWRNMAMIIGHWHLRGYGMWAIEERVSGAFVGRVGPWYTPIFPEPEIGWALLIDFHGRGYATEAAFRARAFAYDVLGWLTAISLIAPENEPSARVARRLGAHPEKRIEWRSVVVDVWRHPTSTAVN